MPKVCPPMVYFLLRGDREVMRSRCLDEIMLETTFFPSGESLHIETWQKEGDYLLRESEMHTMDISISENTLNFPRE